MRAHQGQATALPPSANTACRRRSASGAGSAPGVAPTIKCQARGAKILTRACQARGANQVHAPPLPTRTRRRRTTSPRLARQTAAGSRPPAAARAATPAAAFRSSARASSATPRAAHAAASRHGQQLRAATAARAENHTTAASSACQGAYMPPATWPQTLRGVPHHGPSPPPHPPRTRRRRRPGCRPAAAEPHQWAARRPPAGATRSGQGRPMWHTNRETCSAAGEWPSPGTHKSGGAMPRSPHRNKGSRGTEGQWAMTARRHAQIPQLAPWTPPGPRKRGTHVALLGGTGRRCLFCASREGGAGRARVPPPLPRATRAPGPSASVRRSPELPRAAQADAPSSAKAMGERDGAKRHSANTRRNVACPPASAQAATTVTPSCRVSEGMLGCRVWHLPKPNTTLPGNAWISTS